MSYAIAVGAHVTYWDGDDELEGVVRQVDQDTAVVRVTTEQGWLDSYVPLRSLTLISEH